MIDKMVPDKILSSLPNVQFDKKLLALFNDFIALEHIYSAGVKEIRTKLEILDEEFQVRYDHNPIHHMEYRLKSADSIATKLNKKGLPIEVDAIRNNLTDIAGVRVICNYIDDIYRIADLLISQDDITLIRKKDYIKKPKENGYRSLHLVVEVPIFLAETKQPIPVEIQIRTIAMDFWASLEHHLKYKTATEVPDSVRQELTECANTITKLDNKMQGIHDQLTLSKKKKDKRM